jgi:hypothetical protein
MSLRILFLIFILVFNRASLAAEIVEEGLSVKALGMGNAYLSHAHGHDAVFYNPAGFAGMEGMHWRVSGLSVGLNGLTDVYDKYKGIIDDSDNNLANSLNQLYGSPLWGRTDFQTSLNLGNFIFGAFARANVGLNLMNPAYPHLQSSYFADYAAFVGWGAEIVPDYFDFGFLVKRITRRGGDIIVGPADIAYLDTDRLKDLVNRTGTGYAADIGGKLKFPVDWSPSISAAWQNIGNTSFTKSVEGNAPPTQKSDINLGVGLEKDLAGVNFAWNLDYRHSNYPGSQQVGKKIHTGVELDFPVIALRGGLSQGYYTAGASIDLWLLQLDAATYGVELGEYPGQQEDRRYIVQLTVELGFDSAGNIINLTRSKRSGIKQRR